MKATSWSPFIAVVLAAVLLSVVPDTAAAQTAARLEAADAGLLFTEMVVKPSRDCAIRYTPAQTTIDAAIDSMRFPLKAVPNAAGAEEHNFRRCKR